MYHLWDDQVTIIDLWATPGFAFLSGFQKIVAVFYYAVVSRVRVKGATNLHIVLHFVQHEYTISRVALQCHGIASHVIASHVIASHVIASHVIASHRIVVSLPW